MGDLLGKHWRFRRTWGWLLAAALLPPLVASAAAPTAPPETERAALIVLLDAESRGAPSAEDVVREVNGGRPAPGDLPVGNPGRAEFGITRRAQGNVKAWLRNNPDTTLARLHRYVVLEYPPQANLDAIMQALRNNPHVLHVERDEEGWFSSAANPNDPFLTFDPDPVNYQWGHYLLNVPAAWELTGGHGYVGLADSGVQVNHPDLRAFHQATVNNRLVWIYDGGNVRTHLAWDFGDNDGNVDEMGAEPDGSPPVGSNPELAGHGTHLAGLIAATAENGLGGTGVCQHCSVVPNKITDSKVSFSESDITQAIEASIQSGVQVQSLSFGYYFRDCGATRFSLICNALLLAADRQVLVTAASGNDRYFIEFPASDPRVMAIGGVEVTGSFWDDFPDCPFSGDEVECGSNFSQAPGVSQSLVAPARSVLSTVYSGADWTRPPLVCGDSHHPEPGYGPCTGTSMAAPYVAGIAGLVRSVNPVLDDTAIRQALESTASLGHLSTPDSQMGYGIPDTYAATLAVLGGAGGEPLPNRLTPLFSLYSAVATTHLYTSVPQMASAAVFDCQAPFISEGPQVTSYERFPGVSEEPCPFSGCEPILPRASVFVFTTPAAPFEDAPPLVPLYRMSYDPDFATRCRVGIDPPPEVRRGFFYTTDEAILPSMKNSGYELDGREGYIFQRCAPEVECMPEGSVRLYRLYHPGRDDWILFPETELPTWQAAGYVSVAGLEDWIGYVFLNQDSDLDHVIDGFEQLAGTDPDRTDSDCDGVPDGVELLGLPTSLGYSDPVDGACEPALGEPIFADDFEQGNLVRWLVLTE